MSSWMLTVWTLSWKLLWSQAPPSLLPSRLHTGNYIISAPAGVSLPSFIHSAANKRRKSTHQSEKYLGLSKAAAVGQIKPRGVSRDLRFSPSARFIYVSIQKKKKYITFTFFQKKEKKKEEVCSCVGRSTFRSIQTTVHACPRISVSQSHQT